MEVAEFASSRGIYNEPAFVYWVPFTLRKRDITKKVSHKDGVQLPSKSQGKFNTDKANGNTLWRDALNKEMDNLKVAFDIMLDGKSPPFYYTKQVEI